MSMTITIMGVDMLVIDYIVKLVKMGKIPKARRNVAEIYSVGYKRADAAIIEIQKKLSKSGR